MTTKPISQTKQDTIVVYAVGLVYLSLCAPKTATSEAIEAAANAQAPTGISSRWQIADEATFGDGSPMPGACPDNADRQHWLLVC